ncbi:MAG TPA: peptidylprolyl isomerase [Spirochaetia bacterium]|nr:peptidylprolyl isomerase [Spirochaetia bacterium]
MPSRDIRRAQARKGETVSEAIEKRHTQHPLVYGFSIVVLIVIVVTFILVVPGGGSFFGSRFGSGGTIIFGTYEGRDIAFYPGGYFADQVNRFASYMRSRDPNQSQNPEAVSQAVWYQAFQQTAMHVAELLIAEKSGLQISDDAVDQALLSYPGYLDENGKFSEERYHKASGQEHASTRKLYRENLIAARMTTDIITGVKTGSHESSFIASMAKPERSIQFVSWPFASFPQEEVRKYGEANKSRFQKIKVSRILIKSSEADAAQIRRKLVDKVSSFEELAKTYSKDASADKGGDMGWRYAYDLQADFENKDTANQVLSLKAGEVSEVLKTSYNSWLIYRCDAEATSPDFSNPTVLDDVKAYLTRYEKGKIEDYFNEKAAQLSRRAAQVGFPRAALDAGLTVQHTDYFPINLQNVFSFVPFQAVPQSATPSNAVYSDEFFYRAFALGKDQPSQPVVLDDQILVLKLLGERQMPDSTVNLLGGWIDYAASQSAQSDIAAAIMAPGKLQDNFFEAYAQTFRRQRQP